MEKNWYTLVATLSEAARMWGYVNKQSLLYRLLSLERRAGDGVAFVHKSSGTWLVYLPALYRYLGKPQNERKI